MLVKNYLPTMHNVPEGQRFHLHCSGILKPHDFVPATLV